MSPYLAAIITSLLHSVRAAGPGRWWRASLLAGLGVAATSCEPPTARQAPSASPPPVVAPRAELTTPLPTAAQLGYHRYLGTIDGRPVLAQINCWLAANSYPDERRHAEWEGTFYYRATGRGGWLGKASWLRADQSLETDYREVVGHYYEPIAVLCTDQPPGPLLTGWYTPPGQRRALPVRLYESYADGVRYELLPEESHGPAERHADGTRDSASIAQTYLHLLGSDTLRPALARLQCPPPATRRRARQHRLEGLAADEYGRDFFDITLNEGGLLAYTHYNTQGETGSRYDRESARCYVLDLHAGYPLSLTAQLRPGGLRQVKRMLSRQALADTSNARQRTHWLRAGQLPLPAFGFELTPTGWRASYSEPDDAETSYAYGQTLNWVTLYPLLRLDSPLHRLLRLRGLSATEPRRPHLSSPRR